MIRVSGAPSSNSYQFAGGQADPTGLQYNLARYYDPASGQFTSQDPAGPAGSGISLYQYADDNPVNLSDPTGLSAGRACAWPASCPESKTVPPQ
jgi:RHS repeat-associated protein